MFKFILLVIYIFLPISVIFIEQKNPSEAVAWVIVLLLLPFVGAFIYMIFGSTLTIKITYNVRTKLLKKRYLNSVNSNNLVSGNLQDCKFSNEQNQVAKFNKNYNNSVLTFYDEKEIFTTGKEHYESLFNDLENAKESIHIQYYTVHNDSIGKRFIEILAKKAREGVEVLLMCDYLANITTPRKFFKPLIKANGHVKKLKPFLTHFRSHRKIVVIDKNISYLGGMNVGEKYANMDKIKTPWRDTQIRLTGKCSGILDGMFFSDWYCAVRKRELPSADKSFDKVLNHNYSSGDKPCQIITSGVENNKESIKLSYLSMIRSAKNKIRIQTPYFIPDSSIMDSLKTALCSGVEIEIMVPSIKSGPHIEPLTTYFCGELMSYGAKIYKYKGYIHAKTLTVDNEMCCIGSVNMDMRSLCVDDEICSIFYDYQLVSEYNRIYNNDLDNSYEYMLSDYNNRSNLERFSEKILLLFVPIL